MTEFELRGVALLIGDGPTGLTAVHARVALADVDQVRDRVRDLRAAALDLPVGDRVTVLAAYGRPGRRPLSERFDAPAGQIEALRTLLLDLDR